MYSLISQLSSQFVAKVPEIAQNATTTPVATMSMPQITDLATLWAFIASFGAVRDWIKLFLLGTVLETLRRFAGSIWYSFVESFFFSANFESDDEAYNWMMIWLARQPAWSKARDVQVSTRGWGINDWSSIQLPGEDDSRGSLEKRKLNYLPSFDMTQTLWYKRHWMRFTRSRRQLNDGDIRESLRVSILTRNSSILNRLLLEAKQMYEREEQHRVSIFVTSIYNDWRRSGSRPKRPMESIILDDGVKDMILEDAKDFLASESWYSERGLPYRRGYLFHGCPGSGKTSLVHALAGALNLDIYVINLNKRSLDDSALTQLVSDLPARSIALIEEIDAAFTRGITREPSPGTVGPTTSVPADSAGVTLGGLLSSIDGIQASEGRLLFATTNKFHSLDPALIRPGRMDVHVEFTNASQDQAEELFKRFFTADEQPTLITASSNTATSTEKPKVTIAPTVNMNIPIAPKLTVAERDDLAKQFAQLIPDREFAMANLQGLLMNYKSNPSRVISEVPKWVEKERAARKEHERVIKEAEEKAARLKATAKPEATVEEGPEKEVEKAQEPSEKESEKKLTNGKLTNGIDHDHDHDTDKDTPS